MPVISMISPKGGVGKTTAAGLLATQLGAKTSVAILDADPNQPMKNWGALPGKPASVTIIGNVNQDNIVDKIEEASQQNAFVIVDCEGAATLTASYAIGAADLVIVPCQGSQLDAVQAGKALKFIMNAQKQMRRKIPHAVLFTRTSPLIKTRSLRDIARQFEENGIKVMRCELNEREAFRAMFSFGGTLSDLDPAQVSNIPKAVENARGFANEVLSILRENASVEAVA